MASCRGRTPALNITTMNLASALAASVAKRPEKTALFWGEHEINYTTLLAQCQGVARQLVNQHGVQPGDRVGLWLKNRPEFVPAYFGILFAGAVVVPINNFLKPAEVNFMLQDAGAKLLISETELGGHFEALRAAAPQLVTLEIETLHASQPPAGPEITSPRTEADLAVIIYTSGTTGRPKGAMLSHGNLLHNVDSCRVVLETVDADRFAVILPLFHSYMMTVGMLLPLLVGGSMVLVKSLHPPHHIIKEICERQATIMPAIPQFYRALASLPMKVHLPLRVAVSGAAPLPVQVLHDFEAKHHIPLIEGYGLSEASPVVAKNPLRGERKPGSIGLPVANVEMSIQDDTGKHLGCGETGEVCVRGGNVMMGYWNQPEETAKAMRGDWLLTGDIGHQDADGYFYITDRKKDMLLVNGINVYPREVEEIIYQFAGIKEAAVIGVPDARRGEHPVAYIALQDGATLDDKALLQHIRQKLADYKVPKQIIHVAALPRNATGKILKTQLREQFQKS